VTDPAGLAFLRRTVLAAGRIAMKYYGRLSAGEIASKASPTDLVTEADKKVEAFVKARLARRFPDVAFLGEENGLSGGAPDGRLFVLDPIDGTTNFIHSYPFFAVSLAYKENGRTLAGFVLAPFFKDLYHAVAGRGAFKNRKRIRVSAVSRLIDSIAVTGFACIRGGLKPDNIPVLDKVIYRMSGIRRDGSAALDLCYVAEGRTDIFWEMNLSPWDVAAGALIVEEAGGRVTDFQSGPGYEAKRRIVASNGRLHADFLGLLDSALKPDAGGKGER
jgi:myo-inositol-1(or 4)-monophosphatase